MSGILVSLAPTKRPVAGYVSVHMTAQLRLVKMGFLAVCKSMLRLYAIVLIKVMNNQRLEGLLCTFTNGISLLFFFAYRRKQEPTG